MHIILLRLNLLAINELGWNTLKPINSYNFLSQLQRQQNSRVGKLFFNRNWIRFAICSSRKKSVANLSDLFSYFSFGARTAGHFTVGKCSVADAGRRQFWIWFIVRLRMIFCSPERKKDYFACFNWFYLKFICIYEWVGKNLVISLIGCCVSNSLPLSPLPFSILRN